MSLIEVVICMSLLVLIVLPVFSLLVSSRQSTSESRLYTVARAAAESRIELFKSQANAGETAFGALANTIITTSSTFAVPGLPKRAGGGLAGRVQVCLDENKQFFTTADAPYFVAPFDQVPYPAYHQNLNGDDDSTTYETLAATPVTSTTYRVIPIRVEVYWGLEAQPKVVITTVLGPRSEFIRG
jgi:hypothetical protein